MQGKVAIPFYRNYRLTCHCETDGYCDYIAISHNNKVLHFEHANYTTMEIHGYAGLYCCRASNAFWSFSECLTVTVIKTTHEKRSVVLGILFLLIFTVVVLKRLHGQPSNITKRHGQPSKNPKLLPVLHHIHIKEIARSIPNAKALGESKIFCILLVF